MSKLAPSCPNTCDLPTAFTHTITDVDECVILNGGCEQRCINLAGGYECLCEGGFAFNDNGDKCLGKGVLGSL